MPIRVPTTIPAAALLLQAVAVAQANAWQWTRRDLVPAIESRGGLLARDEFRGVNVMLCSREVDASFRPTSTATWEWADARWCLRSDVTAPTLASALAFDHAQNRLMLFGGTFGAPFATQTWHYDGTAWMQMPAVVQPSWRQGHALAADPLRAHVVLFGGTSSPTSAGPFLNETWEWDGTTWTQRQPPASPPALLQPAMAFDSATRRVALVGGSTSQGGLHPLSTVHEWDGATWVAIPNNAPAGYAHAATTDPAGGLLAAAWSMGSTNLWRWYGATWTELPNTSSLAAMVTEAPDRVFAFGDGFTRNTYGYSRSTGVGGVLQDGLYPIDTVTAALACIEPVDGLFVVCEPSQRTEFWVLTANGSFQSATAVPNIRLGITEAVFHPPSGSVVALGGGGYSWSLYNGNRTLSSLPFFGPKLAGFFPPSGHVLAVLRNAQQNLQVHGYDGTDWSLRATGPALGGAPLGAVDGGRGRLVFVARDRSAAGEWDGTTFTPIPTPPGGTLHAMQPHPDGGVAAFEATVLHRWDGAAWTTEPILNPASGVATPRVPATYDQKRRRWVAFDRGVVFDLEQVGFAADDPTPQPGQTIRFAYDRAASANLPWLLLLATAEAPGIPWRPSPHGGTEVIPLANDWLFGGSLSLGLGGVLDAQGRGTAPLPVPNLPLIGFRCFACAVTAGPPWPLEFVSPTVEIVVRR